MRAATITLVASLLAVAAVAPTAHSAVPRLAGPPGVSASKVLVIGTDGTRIDLVDRLAAQGAIPRLADMAATGFSVPSLLAYAPPEAATLSEVGWSTIATGVWPAKHGVRGYFLNMDPGQATKNGYLDFLSLIERERKELSTFLASDWANIGLHESGGPIFGDSIDARSAVAAENTLESWDGLDQQIADEAARYLREGNPDAGFVYLGIVDEAAHLDGSANPRYLQAIRDTDRRIGQMLDAIRARPTYLSERWLVIVTTDHGQQNLTYPSMASHGFGSDLERMSFVAASGFGLEGTPRFGDIRVVDIAPTVLARLGIPVNPSWNLDGRAFATSPAAPGPTAAARRLRDNRVRVVVDALDGAPGINSVRVQLPKGLRVRSVTATPLVTLTKTKQGATVTTQQARRVSLVVRFRNRKAKRKAKPPKSVQVWVTDAGGAETVLQPEAHP